MRSGRPRGWSAGSSPTPTRAGPGRRPRSTLYAIAAALDAGATGIELDVHATADGRLVVGHDPTVDRTTDRSGAIAELTYRPSCAGWTTPTGGLPAPTSRPGWQPDRYPFRGRAPKDHRFGIALLEEVLEEFPGVVLNLDIKQTAPVVAPYEEALAALLRRFGRVDDVIVASFLDSATDAFSDVRPRDPDLGRHAGGGRLLPGGPGRGAPGAAAPRGPPGAGPLRRD